MNTTNQVWYCVCSTGRAGSRKKREVTGHDKALWSRTSGAPRVGCPGSCQALRRIEGSSPALQSEGSKTCWLSKLALRWCKAEHVTSQFKRGLESKWLQYLMIVVVICSAICTSLKNLPRRWSARAWCCWASDMPSEHPVRRIKQQGITKPPRLGWPLETWIEYDMDHHGSSWIDNLGANLNTL